MESLAQDLQPEFESESSCTEQPSIKIVPRRTQNGHRDLFSEISNSELEIWARRAMASNGFGDY
jgi:hypothetical protein